MTDDGLPPGVSLRDYIERIFDEHEKRSELERTNYEQRLGKLNELRDEVTRDRSQFVQAQVFQQTFNALADRVYKLETFQSRMIGMGVVLLAVVGIAGAVIAKVFGK